MPVVLVGNGRFYYHILASSKYKKAHKMNLLNVYDYEQAAAEKMPAPTYEYYAGGVADNLTLRENRATFDRLKLLPRIFRDASHVSLETTIMGVKRPFTAKIQSLIGR
jgi:FMN-dependent dehydrogenase